MIISHKLKFIYIKNRKVAGTSFEVFFKQFLDPDDIITNIEVMDDDDEKYNETCNPCGFKQHVYASTLKDLAIEKGYLTIDQWYSYDKYTFIRNPWDYMESYYCYYWKKIEKRIKDHKLPPTTKIPPFEKWVLAQDRCHIWEQMSTQYHSSADHEYEYPPKFGNTHEFKVMGYEELPYATWMICGKLGIKIELKDIIANFPTKLSNSKGHFKTEHTKKTIEHVSKLCKNIIHIGGYKYTE